MMSVLYICVSDNNKKIYLRGVRFRGKSTGKLVLIVSDLRKSLASLRFTFLVRSSGQRISSAYCFENKILLYVIVLQCFQIYHQFLVVGVLCDILGFVVKH